MKSILSLVLLSLLLQCGNLNEILEKSQGVLYEDTTPTDIEINEGLKAALEVGINKGVSKLSAQNGFLENPEIKIPFPKDAEVVATTLRDIGLETQVNEVVTSLNRAAENAVQQALPLFKKAILEMSFTDVNNILFGNDTAATAYLKGKTRNDLIQAFQPDIQASLDQVNATKYWEDIMSTYNKIPLVKKIDADLSAYVSRKAINALFLEVERQEASIRDNPIERTTELLKKVFNYAENQ